MKKILLMITSFLMVFMLSGCGAPKTPEGTVKELLKGMVKGETNDVAVKYAANPSILVADETTDVNGLRDAIFSKMTYKITDVKEYEEEATVSLELTTIDMPAVNFYLKDMLAEDEAYAKLAGEAKNTYYETSQVNTVADAKEEDFYRTVNLDLNVKKDDNTWKIEISNEFIYAVLGQRY